MKNDVNNLVRDFTWFISDGYVDFSYEHHDAKYLSFFDGKELVRRNVMDDKITGLHIKNLIVPLFIKSRLKPGFPFIENGFGPHFITVKKENDRWILNSIYIDDYEMSQLLLSNDKRIIPEISLQIMFSNREYQRLVIDRIKETIEENDYRIDTSTYRIMHALISRTNMKDIGFYIFDGNIYMRDKVEEIVVPLMSTDIKVPKGNRLFFAGGWLI